MKTPKWTLLTTAIAVAAVAARRLACPVLAQTAAHDHGAAMTHKLALDQGRKWATDAALRTAWVASAAWSNRDSALHTPASSRRRSTASWPRRSRPKSAASSPTANSNPRPMRCCTW